MMSDKEIDVLVNIVNSLSDASKLENINTFFDELVLKFESEIINEISRNPGGIFAFIDSISSSKFGKHLKKEIMVLFSELLYGKIITLSKDNKAITELFTSKDTIDNFFTNTKDTLFDETYSKRYSLKLYCNMVMILCKFRTMIHIDNIFKKKFNLKFYTYLFYSFNKGNTIFNNYINNNETLSNSLSNAEKQFLTGTFFNSFEYEGLFKLIVVSLRGKYRVYYEFDILSVM